MSWYMDVPTEITIFGYAEAECGPFPCDEHRTCGLEECYPSGRFQEACAALGNALNRKYGGRTTLRVVLLDDGIPEEIRSLVEERHPAVPIVLVDGRLIPLGRVSFTHLTRYLTA
jgi:hypothetical protein